MNKQRTTQDVVYEVLWAIAIILIATGAIWLKVNLGGL